VGVEGAQRLHHPLLPRIDVRRAGERELDPGQVVDGDRKLSFNADMRGWGLRDRRGERREQAREEQKQARGSGA